MDRGSLLPADDPGDVLSVARLSELIKETLAARFPAVWVAGEVSDVARPQSGHLYLTLKDRDAQIRAVIWRGVAGRLRFELEDGMQVICCGDVDVYPPRGTYQLVIRQIEPRGLGALQQALLKLQRKLDAEGLFDPRHKKPLPRFPRRLGVITSPTGAAVRDFLEGLRQRWPGVEVLVIPTKVQGQGAAAEIVRALALANRLLPALDVLVVTRGGGSMEDLWCFNEEPVVRAIFASRVPVVSAIGHEIDVTLSDLVADMRAQTPTEAAQCVVPATEEIGAVLHHFLARLQSSLSTRAVSARMRLEALAQRRVFRRPLERIRDLERRLDELQVRALRAARQSARVARQQVLARANQLESLSPLGVLARGYSLTQRAADGVLIDRADSLEVGQRIQTRYAVGTTISRVESIAPAPQSFEGRS
ncbi:MAG: exodeoxyribonuclease VII large subunit [Pirellulaceae bacterium]